ncbi:hypothetical protein BDB00DRAFT_203628 [Zychaea mexicana]|uniref:uncharacterized protein n=1 Tax=Zychaea mexicana TaxID=64656 RepID=UPI0022FF280C|nr:uncharacterized protein BDB00DRAFT_203628 [Zychaea mexicana]KAI9474846.1 hypothetical protein BDB00DRAFT_203628 [Zychaea mexicana]
MPRSPPQDVHTTMTDPHLQLPKPSSLLLKRSAGQQHHKAPTNLTIFTPSYAHNGEATSIRSAPLHPRASKQNGGLLQQRHQQHTQHRVSKVVSSSSSSNNNNNTPTSILKKRAQPPATAAPWQRQAPQTEFPSPPIVPSQQRCPPQYLRTATFPKTPITNPPHLHSLHQQHSQHQQQQHSHYQQQQRPMTAAIMPVPASTTSALSKKQQFLQPFELLYDNIEQTRQIKSTLDDQIRRSSSLIQTLQSSSSMVEALVRKNVREAMQQQLQVYSNRVEWLEKRMLSSSSANRPNRRTSGSQSSSSNGDHDVDSTTSSSSSPPSSQVGRVLSELVDRLDRLETKMDTRSN